MVQYMKNVHVSLDMFSGLDLGIIVPRPSGVVYSNQAEGCACIRPKLEGIYIPFGFFPERENEPNHKELSEYFIQKHGNRGCLTIDTANFIDEFLFPAELPFTAYVDRTRLTESYEAWVWLNLTAPNKDNYDYYTTFETPLNAVLVWPNSD